jgi:hypothetical protein
MTSLWIVPLSHDNGGDLAAIITLISLNFTPIAKEMRFVLACAWRKALDAADAGVAKALVNKADEIEVGTQIRTSVDKKSAESGVAG